MITTDVYPFIYQRRVYYADTDAGGIVYHAHYFRFAEEARAELLCHLNIDQKELRANDIFFVVAKAQIDYLKPAYLGDMLTIETHLVKKTNVRFFFKHIFKRAEEVLAEIELVVVCVNAKGRPQPIPDCFHQ